MLDKKREQDNAKNERLAQLRKSDKIRAKKRANDLNEKMENAAKFKEESVTTANKQVWLKQEASRLRIKEIEEDKDFFDNERKAQHILIL